MTKIIEFRAQNFAKLTAVSIRPDGSLVQITGKNSQGKTSVLHGIWTALVGRSAAPPQPVHAGAEEARLNLDLGTMKIVRTFKKGKAGDIIHDLKVSMADGSRVGVKPQAMIDALLGDLSFNPLEFVKLKPADQFERVKALVPGFDFEANAQARTKAFAARTEANRTAARAQAQADGIQLPPGPKPQRIDVTDLAAKLREANDHNIAVRDQHAARAKEQEAIDQLLENAERLRAQATDIENRCSEREKKLAALPPIAQPINTDAIAGQIASSDAINRTIAIHESRAQYERQAKEASDASDALTAIIERCDQQRQQAIAEAKMPVDGLSFGDGEVLLNGLPIAQAATSEKIKASMAIGMALNPDLKVMLVDEGSELDSQSLAAVAKMADDHGYQVWIARVAEGDAAKAGFEIVDGTNAE